MPTVNGFTVSPSKLFCKERLGPLKLGLAKLGSPNKELLSP
jgi:hypothetical protein